MDNHYVKLAGINVNDKIEKKNGLSYLSWAWAVDQLMREDPAANWTYLEPAMFGETMMVRCAVTAFGKTMTCHLPVMDHRNKPIPKPDAFQVNTAMQRCLVKAIALHGLGLYIYAGEDLPETSGAESAQGIGNGPKHSVGDEKRQKWEAMPEDEQKFLQGIHADLTALLDEKREDDAYGFLRAKFATLDVDEQLALQYLFTKEQTKALAAAGKRFLLTEQVAVRQADKAGRPDIKAAA